MKKIIFPLIFLAAASLLTLFTISTSLFWLQLIWYFLGFMLVLLFVFFDWHLIFNYRWFIWGFYFFVNFLLVVVYFMPKFRGTHSWFSLGPIHFQPVELAKISLVLIYASYFSVRHLKINRFKTLFESLAIAILPALLVFFEPALGSAVILLSIWFGFLLISGLSIKKFFVAILIFILMCLISWQWLFKDYQKQRILNFLHPSQNSLTYNYNITQSKIAIGSGGIFGKGFNQGAQVRLGFLPEPESDFIFAAFSEQWGLFGGLILLSLFFYLLFQILKIGEEADQNFEKFICLGAVIIFGLQLFLNISSEVGFLPVVGINLPFLSYGGTGLLTSLFLIAIINAIERKF